MTDLRIWCLLIDREKKDTFGDAFSIIVGPDARIEDLKEKAKEKRPVVLGNVDLPFLTVWRCMNPILLVEVEWAQLQKDLSNVDFTDRTKIKRLGSGQKITTLGSSEEILLIEVPEDFRAVMAIPSSKREVAQHPGGLRRAGC
ncbi:hypothetical protein ACEPAG_3417 [Sanghuangporus baumii]